VTVVLLTGIDCFLGFFLAYRQLNYDAFCILKDNLPKKMHRYFTTKVFLLFPLDSLQRISGVALCRYIFRRGECAVALMQPETQPSFALFCSG